MNSSIKIAHMVLGHRFLERCGKIAKMTLYPLLLEAQIICLCTCKHLVSVINVLLSCSYVLWYFRQ